MNDQLAFEQRLMDELRTLLASDRIQQVTHSIASELLGELRADPAGPKSMFRPVSLATYGGNLSPGIGSSWVFVLRDGFDHPPERHPGSIQRMFALMEPGCFDWWDGRRWVSELLVPGGPGLSIPADTWHRMPTRDADWVVVSFHTAEPDQLVEIVGDPESGVVATSRAYLG